MKRGDPSGLNPFPDNFSSFAAAYPVDTTSGNYDHAVGLQNGGWLPAGAPGYSGMQLTMPIYAPYIQVADEHTDSQLWAQTGTCDNWYNPDGSTDYTTQNCPVASDCSGANGCAVQSLEVASFSQLSAPGITTTTLQVFMTSDGYITSCYADGGGDCCGNDVGVPNSCWVAMGMSPTTPPTMTVSQTLATTTTVTPYGSAPYELQVGVVNNGDAWWVYVNGLPIGFYPLPDTYLWPGTTEPGPMTGQATYLQAGGEVDQFWPDNVHSDTSMVSDRPASEGYGYAAYERNVLYYDSTNASHDANLQYLRTPTTPASEGDFNFPGLCGLQSGGWADAQGNPGAYSITNAVPAGPSPAGTSWGEYFYFGGGRLSPPGGSVLTGTFPQVISVGSQESACALTPAGGVECWGDNTWGQLGNGSTSSSPSPVQVTGLTGGVIGVSVGGESACAVTTNGDVMCWGDNDNGEIGPGTVTSTCGESGGFQTPCSTTPVQVTGFVGKAVAVSVGGGSACALTGVGEVWCWGDNESGALGDDGVSPDQCGGQEVPVVETLRPCSHAPQQVTGLSASATAISVGGGFACAVLVGGDVMCWGSNYAGELGNASTATCYLAAPPGQPTNPEPCSMVPVTVQALSSAAMVSAGVSEGSACAVTTAGAVMCWGANESGQLGVSPSTTTCQGGDTCSMAAVAVSGLGSGVIAVSTSGEGACAFQAGPTDGVWCWGTNSYGTLANGTTSSNPSPVPTKIASGLTSDVLAVSVGFASACTLNADGSAACWGDNSAGEIGDGTMSAAPDLMPTAACFP